MMKSLPQNPMVHMMLSGMRGSMVSLNFLTHMMMSGLMGWMVLSGTLPMIGMAGGMSLNPNRNLVGDPVYFS